MLRTRVIPCLLLKEEGLVKTVEFKNPKYVGDPINAVRIFNEKEIDELIFLDIYSTVSKKRFSLTFLRESPLNVSCPLPMEEDCTASTI
jgi:cyclase